MVRAADGAVAFVHSLARMGQWAGSRLTTR